MRHKGQGSRVKTHAGMASAPCRGRPPVPSSHSRPRQTLEQDSDEHAQDGQRPRCEGKHPAAPSGKRGGSTIGQRGSTQLLRCAVCSLSAPPHTKKVHPRTTNTSCAHRVEVTNDHHHGDHGDPRGIRDAGQAELFQVKSGVSANACLRRMAALQLLRRPPLTTHAHHARSSLSIKAVRRTLEEQMGLGLKELDHHKELVSRLIDEVRAQEHGHALTAAHAACPCSVQNASHALHHA